MAMDRRKQKNREMKYASAKDRAEKRESGFESTSIKIPDGMTFFSFKKSGIYRIDVFPYLVGKGNPFADEGMYHYERTYFCHRNIGTGQNAYVCLAKTFNKRCPICEHRSQIESRGGDQETIKSLKSSERQLWIVKDLNNAEEGFMLMDQSHYLFGRHIDAKVAAADPEDGYETFFHLEGGKTLKISVTEQSFLGRSYNAASDIEMKPRKQDYDTSIMDDMPCLDDLLVELSYDKLKKIFEAVPGEETEEDEEEEETPKKSKGKSSKKEVEEESEDEDSDEEDEEPEPPKKKAGKTPAKKKPDPNDEDEEDEELDSSDLEEDEEDGEDSSDLEEEEDEPDAEDQDDDEEPKKKAGKTPPKKPAPVKRKK